MKKSTSICSFSYLQSPLNFPPRAHPRAGAPSNPAMLGVLGEVEVCHIEISPCAHLWGSETPGGKNRWKKPYPLVNCHILPWKITMLLMGKSTISMAIFNCYVNSPEKKGEKKLLWMIAKSCTTMGWNPINHGMFTIYQLVQDFFHPL